MSNEEDLRSQVLANSPFTYDLTSEPSQQIVCSASRSAGNLFDAAPSSNGPRVEESRFVLTMPVREPQA